MPYLMGGFPDLDTSCRIGVAYAESGADLLELGIPFSDPLADISPCESRCRHRGAARRSDAPRRARGGGADRRPRPGRGHAPLHRILARGLERFLDAVSAAGVSGLIVPDLPFEEAPETLAACDAKGLALGATRGADHAGAAAGGRSVRAHEASSTRCR